MAQLSGFGLAPPKERVRRFYKNLAEHVAVGIRPPCQSFDNGTMDMLIARSGWSEAPPTILIVEDDPAVRRSLLLLLQGRGFGAKAWSAADPALAEAARAAPDCLIVDYRLESSDGIAMLGALRAQGWDGPAILISAYSSEELSARAREAGFALVLEKPLREHMLVDAVTRLTRSDTQSASP